MMKNFGGSAKLNTNLDYHNHSDLIIYLNDGKVLRVIDRLILNL